MRVTLYDGTPDDAALEIASCGSWSGDFSELEFPDRPSRFQALVALLRDGRCWLDRGTLAVVENE